jgi:hypothetical protein
MKLALGSTSGQAARYLSKRLFNPESSFVIFTSPHFHEPAGKV